MLGPDHHTVSSQAFHVCRHQLREPGILKGMNPIPSGRLMIVSGCQRRRCVEIRFILVGWNVTEKGEMYRLGVDQSMEVRSS
jgi:hypothetical protein